MCLVLGIRSSVGVLALPFRQTKPFQPSCYSRKSILGSILTVLNACFSIKLIKNYSLVTEHACLEYKEICTYIHKLCLHTTKTDDQSRV